MNSLVYLEFGTHVVAACSLDADVTVCLLGGLVC